MIHEICQNLHVKQDHDLGIHIPSHAVILDDCNLIWMIQITSKVALRTSAQGFAQPQNLFKNFYMILYIFPDLITSHPLKSFRIMENNKQLLSAVKS